MQPARQERAALKFVRALLTAGAARPSGGAYVVDSPRARLRLAEARRLASSGVVEITDTACRPTAEARSWVRRELLGGDAFAAQHRLEATAGDGVRLNLAESPLARLAFAPPGERPFLEPHQVEAGERLRRLVERAHLQPRVTMSYSAAHTADGGRGGSATEIGDMAADARRELSDLLASLPRECADVLLDVCGMVKGLQVVEAERGWPRRSAKLVLRIGLDQLARRFGLTPEATGRAAGRPRAWLDEGARPMIFD